MLLLYTVFCIAAFYVIVSLRAVHDPCLPLGILKFWANAFLHTDYGRRNGVCVSSFYAESWTISSVPFSAALTWRWTVASGESNQGAQTHICPFQFLFPLLQENEAVCIFFHGAVLKWALSDTPSLPSLVSASLPLSFLHTSSLILFKMFTLSFTFTTT